MMNVVAGRHEFPPATKTWAWKLGREPKKIIQVKQWREHNKELIEACQFAEAIWLPGTAESNQVNDLHASRRFAPQNLPLQSKSPSSTPTPGEERVQDKKVTGADQAALLAVQKSSNRV
jgi:hypothetical protein